MATRREFLTAAGAGAAGLAVGSGGALFERDDGSSSSGGQIVPFHGRHQAGIATAAQDKLVFAAFDVTLATKGELRELFHEWTKAAALMTKGLPVGRPGGDVNAPPTDTGEALGLGPRSEGTRSARARQAWEGRRADHPPQPHIRLAAPSSNDGQAILRRGYSFTDGIDVTTGSSTRASSSSRTSATRTGSSRRSRRGWARTTR